MFGLLARTSASSLEILIVIVILGLKSYTDLGFWVRDNQLDEFANQSILADVSVVSPGSASAESGSFGIQIGSPQLCPEAQIPNSSLILLLVMSLVMTIV